MKKLLQFDSADGLAHFEYLRDIINSAEMKYANKLIDFIYSNYILKFSSFQIIIFAIILN